jgi:hypothetical protein
VTHTGSRRLWLAGLASLGLHAAVLIPLTLLPTPRSLMPGQPLGLGAVIIQDDVKLSPVEPPPESVLNIQLLPAKAPSTSTPAAPVVEPLPPSLSGPIRPVTQVASAGAGAVNDGGEGAGTGPGHSADPLFAPAARARSVVFVIDRSVSMGLNGALAQVKRELMASLDRLPSDVRFQIIFYNRSAQPLILGGAMNMALATPANRQAVAQQLEALAAEGATDHLPALSLALAYDADVIYFLTDADDLRPEQVRQVSQMNRGRAIIHTIELTTANADRRDMPLQMLARENRGTYRAVALR